MIRANSKEEKKREREWGKKKQLRMYINREKRNPYDSSGKKKKRNRRVPYGPACLLVVNDGWKCMCVLMFVIGG
jgi:hypothetical protein